MGTAEKADGRSLEPDRFTKQSFRAGSSFSISEIHSHLGKATIALSVC